jgi:heme oxygenase
MTIMEKLKTSTASFHVLSEELNFSKNLLDHTMRREDYLVMLKRLYSLFTQVGILQKSHEQENSIPSLFFDGKARLISEDIRTIDDTLVETYVPFGQLARFEYLGFSYVALGSMLGGQQIYRNIVDANSGKNATLPFSFYASCKESSLSHWKTFTEDLKSIAPENHESILAGATIAYLYFIYLCVVITK